MKAKQWRMVHLVLMLLWLVPGGGLSWYFRDSVPWVVFMSWFACVYSTVSAWAGETPVEIEEEAT